MRTLEYVKKKIAEIYHEKIICLSNKYEGNKRKLLCRCCVCSHEWEANFNSLSRKHGCPKCSKRAHRTLEDILIVISQRGGTLLSNLDKIRNHIKFKIRCNNGHEFQSSVRALFHDKTWCPICRSNIRENICRKIMEKLFNGEPFPNVRPKWLKNREGHVMQLDGYSDNLKLAFEYNGEQHYHNVVFFKNTAAQIQNRDLEKAQLCKTLNINLIVVPYSINNQDIENFIREKCKQLHIIVPNNDKIDIEEMKIYSSKLEEFKTFCLNHGIVCLSNKYLGAFYHMDLECKTCKHQWKSSYSNLKKHPCCPECRQRKGKNGT